MAIIIPVSNIHNVDNEKVVNNIIDSVEVEYLQIDPKTEYKVPVFNENTDFSITEVTNKKEEHQDALALNSGGNTSRNIRASCGLSFTAKVVDIPNIYIPKLKDNKRITKIYNGKDDNNTNEIKLSVRVKQRVYNGAASYNPSTNIYEWGELPQPTEETIFSLKDFDYKNDISATVSNLQISSASYLSSFHSFIEKDDKVTISSSLYAHGNNNWSPEPLNVNAEYEFVGSSPNFSVVNAIVYGKEYYKINPSSFYGAFNVDFFSALFESTQTIADINSWVKATATRIEQTIEEVTITVYGNTIGINLIDKTIKYDNGENPYKISRNELLQANATSNGTILTENLSSNILSQYKNGKETATILCSISDYYNNLGNLVISKKNAQNMLFKIYDEVVPMVNNGTPLSLSSDGKAKTFALLGSRIYYDGAVWQELSLQEKNKIPYIGGTENLKYEVVSNGNYCRCLGGNEDNSTIEITEFIGFLPNACYVEEIADNAFKNNLNLKEIILPREIKYIGSLSFAYCQNVEKIIYQCKNADLTDTANAPFWRVGENVANTVVVIGSFVEKIPAYLFASDDEEYYSRINELDFGGWSNCRLIEESAFSYCKDLKLLNAPVSKIGRFAFSDCTGLQKVYLENISVIDRYAFSNCTTLYEIHFGKSLKRISLGAFRGCNNFADIYYEGTFEDWQKVEIESNNGDVDETGSFMGMVSRNNIHYEEF